MRLPETSGYFGKRLKDSRPYSTKTLQPSCLFRLIECLMRCHTVRMPAKRRKLTPEQIEQLRSEYEALDFWDPNCEGVNGLIERWEISKPTLYRYRESWTAAGEMADLRQEAARAEQADMNAALATTVHMVSDLRLEARQLQRENEQLRTQLDADRQRVADLTEVNAELRAALKSMDPDRQLTH